MMSIKKAHRIKKKRRLAKVIYSSMKERIGLLNLRKENSIAEHPSTYQKTKQNCFLDTEEISKVVDITEKKLKQPNPNKLPFLHAQILERIYFNISEGKNIALNELAKITDYSSTSKILLDAIEALVKKGFLEGTFAQGFKIPNNCGSIYKKVINKFSTRQKKYSNRIVSFLSNPNSPSLLFEERKSISEFNRHGVIHKWYNYLEEFPFFLIEEKIKKYGINHKSLIVDPFCGSGTTLITANFFQSDAIGFDANPLMTFISKVKTTWDINLEEFRKITLRIASEFLNQIHNVDKIKSGFLINMSKRELNQWLSLTMQKEVGLLKDLIDCYSINKIRDLLYLCLAKSCFDGSYVALCPGTTFYPFREKEEFWDIFAAKVMQVYNDLKLIQKYNSYGETKLITDTCLNAGKYIKSQSIDFMITSPPYPNDLEYTRQTRLEMYLLDFVKNMDEVQQIKRKMVKGSTKLIFKESNSSKEIAKFNSITKVTENIYEQLKNKNWGFDYPRMVSEYFGDMYLCLKEFLPLLKKDAYFLLVVGDQTIKGVYIPVCNILIEIANEIGYRNCHKELFRNRRSSGHNIILPEEIVVIQK